MSVIRVSEQCVFSCPRVTGGSRGSFFSVSLFRQRPSKHPTSPTHPRGNTGTKDGVWVKVQHVQLLQGCQ